MPTGDRDRVILAEMVAKCWQDPAFKAKFVASPAACLREAGMDIPASKRVEVLENTHDVTYLGLADSQPVADYASTLLGFIEAQTPMKPGTQIRLVQSSADYLPLIVPLPPKAFVHGELTDSELMAMAGGDYLWEGVNVATTANAVAEANGAAVQNAAVATEATAAAVAVAVIAVVLI